MTDHALHTAGITDASDRKLILAAFRKAGYKPQSQQRKAPKRKTSAQDAEDVGDLRQSPSANASLEAGSSSLSTPTQSPAKRRKRTVDKNEFLSTPADAAFNGVTDPASIDFDEVTDERVLESKRTVVNRAPVMAAWATVVAERLGFKRSEALSIGAFS